jgi:hypothetical protein
MDAGINPNSHEGIVFCTESCPYPDRCVVLEPPQVIPGVSKIKISVPIPKVRQLLPILKPSPPMVDCHICRREDRRNCMGKERYNFSDFRFCSRQVYFIIEHFLALNKDDFVLKEIEWQPDPAFSQDKSTYITKRVSKEAKFCKPMEIVAEVEKRLIESGRRGQFLVTSIMGGLAMENLPGEAWLTLLYISGWRRRRVSFAQWKYKRNHL